MGKLTVLKARSFSEPGFYGDGGTLFLRVAPGGSKSWVQRISINGKRTDIGLGGFSLVTLAEARDKAFENRRLARTGGDPLAAKRKAAVPTFREAAEQTFAANRPRWRNGKHTENWMRSLELYAFPLFGQSRVDRITQQDVLGALSPLWAKRAATARKVRQRLRATFRWCQAHGFIETNPAGEAVEGALPAMPRVKAHFRALQYGEVREALDVVAASGAGVGAKLCFRFVVLTAVRSGEARLAQWDEFDLAAKVWTIPGPRMKTGVAHTVPLSAEALQVLAEARALHGGDHVFPSPVRQGQPLSNMALTKMLRTTGLADRCTVHGFRSSFRTWAAEQTRTEHAVMEMALSHTVGSAVEQAYSRGDLLGKRRRLMDAWARFLSAKPAKVVELHRG